MSLSNLRTNRLAIQIMPVAEHMGLFCPSDFRCTSCWVNFILLQSMPTLKEEHTDCSRTKRSKSQEDGEVRSFITC